MFEHSSHASLINIATVVDLAVNVVSAYPHVSALCHKSQIDTFRVQTVRLEGHIAASLSKGFRALFTINSVQCCNDLISLLGRLHIDKRLVEFKDFACNIDMVL